MVAPSPTTQTVNGRREDASRHALVIGGSMAGLWSARVLANHFDRVTIIERDRFPDGPEWRKGVPQARHVHILLVRGMQILEELFPGLEDELAAAGAPLVDWSLDCASRFVSGWGPRFRSGLATRTCSRALLEWRIRQRLAAHGRITFLPEHDVLDLRTDATGQRVTGVVTRRRDGTASGPTEELHADFVVDASGRDAKTAEWLAAHDYGQVAETTINSFLGYASRWYRRPAGFESDWKAMLVFNQPPHNPRSGVIYPVEDDRWIVTLGGAARDYPPQDEAGFLDFARSLADPALYLAIKDAEPLTPIYGYRRTENRLRHYERLPRWPAGLVALGDAVCAFNPVYGQGMTTSANAALALDRCLRAAGGDPANAARQFQHDLARVNATPWLLATSEDFRWPATEGGRPDRKTRLMHRYMNQVTALAGEQPAVEQAFFNVLHLVEPPTTLFQPAVLGRVVNRVLNPAARARHTPRQPAAAAMPAE
jgi:2-polyprenyl-6-methoxyphenol hydroxylase-like FAD-dependent oxidoreductase